MINFLTALFLSISEFFHLPTSIEEIAPWQWVVLFIVAVLLLLLVIKIWQKLVIFLIKLILLAFVVLVVYLLVVGW